MNKSSVVKNEKYVVDIIDNGFEGEGIAKIDGLTVFVPGSIKGEKCEILIVKVLASHAYGKIVNIIEKSENRKESDCATYKRCGGCSLRHMTYESTLKLKRQVVQNLVNKGLTKKVEVLETIGMENPYNYRNKAQYPVGLNSEGQPEVGVFAQRTHTIIPIQTCLIQTEISQKIAKTILNFVKEKNIQVYNEENQKGLLRHIVIKVGKYTNQVMCILVVNDSKFNQEQELVKLLCEKYPEIKTIVKNINNKTNKIKVTDKVKVLRHNYKTRLYEFVTPNDNNIVSLKETDIICNLGDENNFPTVDIYTEYGLGKILDINNNVIPTNNTLSLFANLLDLKLDGLFRN